ncbi:MAG: hypothetical protein DKM50_13295 [Candidatus Margulisiibacteriota bacterium]|nr:MAG: hypothetical protein A2X43_13550 [Candidatus Margulisbacteria bacterium GWD2_39_127]OGI05331.1 MAG: hypothetical protein A2X42_05760 [Candidatus Margulisbacteria bacterium GWF2_38_17]OGI06044.1 MAG: hypothetical protein A2X41_06275 [Candidatus Margulisbacteria bacterium GWE2_39_32]PZM77316.1 MAG: hypothetical protein DKM50_13295 [Candidatus Margulisiibacteriota bacterium]HAR62568.1 hypothetical protein [Candidatus Margulisiibacteriota bacterium]
MKKILALAITSIIAMSLIGCGKITRSETEVQSLMGQTTAHEIASNIIMISIGKPGMLNTNQSVTIEPSVPGSMTFSAVSNIQFNVTSHGKIEAEGYITLNIAYADLDDPDLLRVRAKAKMLAGDGLIGQQNADSVIPLELESVAEYPYQELQHASCITLKSWNAPFKNSISQVITIKVKGDFTNATEQQYKGAIKLLFVRDQL